MNSLEIKDKKNKLKIRANEIIDLCKKEVRDLTKEEEDEIKNIKDQINTLNDELKALEDRLANLKFDEDEKEDETEQKSDEENTPSDEDEEKEENKSKSNIRNTMKKSFSLVKAIRSIANNQQLDEVSAAVIAKGNEEARKAGISVQGQIQLPTETRAAVTVAAEGEDIVATDLFDILTPLRAKNVLAKAGAKFMGGLVGNVQIPVMGAENVGWAGEIADAADGAGTFSNVTLTPKRLTAYIDISKQLIAQDSIDVENAIRQDLINAINGKLEETILGSGDGKAGGLTIVAPIGMQNGVTPTSVATFADVCDVEAEIEDANVIGECVYVMSNKAKAALRAMAKGTKSTQLVYENGTVDGTAALNTSHLGSGKTYIYGDFSNLAIGSWGGIDLTVDPYTKAAAGQVRIVVNAFFDAAKLRDNAFAFGTIA